MTLGGCATAQPPAFARLFVQQGTPAMDLGGPPAAAAARRDTPEAARPIADVSRYSSMAVSLEATNPRLRESLGALSQAPTLEHHLAVARDYHRLGILDRAYDYLQMGAALSPNSAAVHDATARVWRDWGLPEFGLSAAYRAVHAAPQSAAARHTLGTLFHALGLRTEALTAFQETVNLDPTAWYAWQNLCVLAMKDGRTKEAIGFCRRANTLRLLKARQGRR
ncbi:MAG: hypothetical protein ACT4QD_01600 [Acidobacteriota bacterium]